MRGKHHIMVQNSRLRYEMDIRRNITIIRGDSATGKTTLIQMLEQFSNLGEDSGIEVVCDKEIQILSGRNWKGMLDSLEDQILFIDEQNTFIKTEEFAAAVQDSSCYFVLVTREDLPNLPYSVEEIYGIHTSGKYHETRRIYNELYHLYSLESDFSGIRTDALVTEDSDSGFEFFNSLSEHRGIPCVSAQGKSNLPKTAKQFGSQNILLIADGAAIGPEMNSLYQMMQRNHRMRCYLPESFEWLILNSGLIDSREIRSILKTPEDYIESRDYFSWERYFTKLLVESTKDSYRQYSKSHLNSYYLQERSRQRILDTMPDLGL